MVNDIRDEGIVQTSKEEQNCWHKTIKTRLYWEDISPYFPLDDGFGFTIIRKNTKNWNNFDPLFSGIDHNGH